jgi:hypothetical protein
MRFDPSCSRFFLGLLVIVSPVEADIVRPEWTAWRSQRNNVERLTNHLHIVNVGAGKCDGERNTLAVG